MLSGAYVFLKHRFLLKIMIMLARPAGHKFDFKKNEGITLFSIQVR